MITSTSTPKQHALRYNAFLGLQEADDLRVQKQAEFDHLLENLAEIVANSRSQRLLGLYLIHKHFDLDVNEINIETTYKKEDGTTAYISQAMEKSDVSDIAPSSWQIVDSKLIAVDFSTSDYAKEVQASKEVRGHLTAMAAMISAAGFADVVGPFVNRAEHITISKDGYMWLERTDLSRRANILEYRKPDHSLKMVKTGWNFMNSENVWCPVGPNNCE